ncbi:hypothetical protein ANCCAN_10796 [Ancylostoma caninum]|uniref:Uncharacterized protein n=1 Tax=Ancylostoma caninum TaxID=29170 RepID=A0A368GFQ9_ANCCA|nr:hypothetical protein ANCCAN_10796 [Ancylostoma caninum]
MLTLLFLVFHSSRVMEILVMVVAAVIIFNEILGCKPKQKQQSSRRMNTANGGMLNSLEKKQKEKDKEPKPKTAMPLSVQPTCETQADSVLGKAIKEGELRTEGKTAKSEDTKDEKKAKTKGWGKTSTYGTYCI